LVPNARPEGRVPMVEEILECAGAENITAAGIDPLPAFANPGSSDRRDDRDWIPRLTDTNQC